MTRRLHARTSPSSPASTTPDGKGNATVYVGYRDLDAMTQDQRDFSACALSSSAPATDTGVHVRRFGHDGLAGVLQRSTRAIRGSAPAGAIVLGAAPLRDIRRRDLYNFAPSNYYQRPDERKSAGVFAHYDFSDDARPSYAEFMFMDDRTDRADRTQRRVPRRRSRPAAVLRPLRGELQQSAAVAARPWMRSAAATRLRPTRWSTSAGATSKAVDAGTICAIPRIAGCSA